MDESLRGGQHIPVMLGPVLELLNCGPDGLYVDATLGGGGYARAILDRSAPEGVVLGMDWDEQAIGRARERLGAYGDRLILEKADFADIRQALREHRIDSVDGIAADLGVSSFQLDDPGRGFSFTHEGPLDMRMNRDLNVTAADLVNTLPEKDLADLIYRFGEERLSRRIAGTIVMERKKGRISTTLELAEMIRKAVPRTKDSARIHPATRTFQALRIAVNRELESLKRFLDEALDVLRPGGRLCVVAFHSLEDRVVKERFKNWARSCRCPREVFQCTCGGEPLVRILTRKALRPSPDEAGSNPRSRSARLRAVEKL
ncbi:MAG: 16S rRNA (cytosine(1402)-N(4))-methyltransferase RsmH [Desulfobacteraceae bacterium]|nr:16S rRNA (cytosine(1402)-N(4))-methyltransferase RsmH [Desulfobacteraceae bacterium]